MSRHAYTAIICFFILTSLVMFGAYHAVTYRTILGVLAIFAATITAELRGMNGRVD